jgi:hypothetical protein
VYRSGYGHRRNDKGQAPSSTTSPIAFLDEFVFPVAGGNTRNTTACPLVWTGRA